MDQMKPPSIMTVQKIGKIIYKSDEQVTLEFYGHFRCL